MTYRDDVAALAARRAALEHEVASSSRELAETTRLLDEARARRGLPVLGNIRIASPCKARWSEMTGDERKRDCADCRKAVFNLSALTRDEAEALIVEHAGNLCARYYQRADGTILLADCTVAASARRRQLVLAAGATAMLAGTVASAIADATATDAAPITDHSIDGHRETIQPRGAMRVAEDPPPLPQLPPPLPAVPQMDEEIIRIVGYAPIVDVVTVVMGGLTIDTEPIVALPPSVRQK